MSARGVDGMHNKKRKERVIFANENSTQELIEKSEFVLTINSTVGVESLLLGKKVITLGNACYNIDGLVRHATNADQLVNIIDSINDWEPDLNLLMKFLNYLNSDYLVPDSYKNPGNKHWQVMNEKINSFINA